MIEINNDTVGDDGFPSEEMTAVIEEIMTMSYFDDDDQADFDSALDKMNKTLRPYKLELEFDESTDSVSLQSFDGTFVSTAHRNPKNVQKITFSPRVFEIPESPSPNSKLVAIMMPFGGSMVCIQRSKPRAPLLALNRNEQTIFGTIARFSKTYLI